ncbi:DUF2726 domain-containing protein [Leisingera sp. S132]|uniref:DUF2726 domain-containing protein n=1 Tax=Leisingera sp. S132 TaxID=2867016 RepID=UPI0021A7F505|nr:DUF2726 domain-containing protein [Leisingera sp. S132]UWQ77836.1 DUF2726 domain-containing protein [Leisingera sp. S132]
MTDPKNQAAAVAKVNFEKTKLMNASEFRVFAALEKIIDDLDEGYRVMAQTSLGEVIKPKPSSGDWKERKNAFASINSKRLDFAVIDKFGFVALAVEYQGSGHHQETAFIRDAVKKEALRRAGIRLLEVEKGTTPKELKQSVLTSLGKNGTDAA